VSVKLDSFSVGMVIVFLPDVGLSYMMVLRGLPLHTTS
jgi:hypothetical protein